MPLKLIERVLPWLVGSLTEDEVRRFLENMHLAGSTSIYYFSVVAYSKIIEEFNKCTASFFSSDSSSLIQLQCQIQPW